MAKLRPEEREERYMSRRPCFSCWRRGRSVRGVVPGRVAVAEAVGEVTGNVGAGVLVEVGSGLLVVVGLEGVGVVVVVAVAGEGDGAVGFGGTALTGRGWAIGVS